MLHSVLISNQKLESLEEAIITVYHFHQKIHKRKFLGKGFHPKFYDMYVKLGMLNI
jgi:hypothetical protein